MYSAKLKYLAKKRNLKRKVQSEQKKLGSGYYEYIRRNNVLTEDSENVAINEELNTGSKEYTGHSQINNVEGHNSEIYESDSQDELENKDETLKRKLKKNFVKHKLSVVVCQ